MSIALLLLPAVGGYWFVTHFNLTKFQAIRESGYHILFRSVLVGIFWYSIAAVLVWSLEKFEIWEATSAIKWLASVFPQPFTVETVAAIALGGSSPYILNIFYSKERGHIRAAENTGDHMELLVSEALQNQLPVEISLRNRKLYIGFITGQNATRHSDVAISLIPLYSGHRTEDNLNLVIDIDYGHTIPRFVVEEVEEEDWNPNDVRVVIPVTEIVSARLFDIDLYRAFQNDFTSVENRDNEGYIPF